MGYAAAPTVATHSVVAAPPVATHSVVAAPPATTYHAAPTVAAQPATTYHAAPTASVVQHTAAPQYVQHAEPQYMQHPGVQYAATPATTYLHHEVPQAPTYELPHHGVPAAESMVAAPAVEAAPPPAEPAPE